jgi:hypothetical protein
LSHTMLMTETYLKKFYGVDKYVVRFIGKVTFELGFDFTLFRYAIENIDCFLLIFGNFTNMFHNFNLLTAIIQFVNLVVC